MKRWSARRIEGRRGRRLSAILAAALVVAAQTVALAHYHDLTLRFAPHTTSVGDTCELCVLEFHAPFSPATKPAITRPFTEPIRVFIAKALFSRFSTYSFSATRAPPALG